MHQVDNKKRPLEILLSCVYCSRDGSGSFNTSPHLRPKCFGHVAHYAESEDILKFLGTGIERHNNLVYWPHLISRAQKWCLCSGWPTSNVRTGISPWFEPDPIPLTGSSHLLTHLCLRACAGRPVFPDSQEDRISRMSTTMVLQIESGVIFPC